MYAPRMQTAVKDSIERALAATRADDMEQSWTRAEYYRIKRLDYLATMIDVLNAMYWVMSFSTYLVFVQLLAQKLESMADGEMRDYQRTKYM